MNNNLKTKNLKDSSVYFRPSVATDGVVFKIFDNELHVLLVKRKLSETGTTREIRPYQGYWALPGGFIRGKETAEDALLRELKEETNLNLKFKSSSTKTYQFGFYSQPDRDAWSFEGDKKGEGRQTMSVAYIVTSQASHTPTPDTDAIDARYIKVNDIFNKKIENKFLAFDHNQILMDAVSFFVNKLAFEPVALDFCDNKFTVGDVRMVYECFWKVNYGIEKIELGNFQNKLLKQTDENGNSILIPLPDKPENKRAQEGRGAPALLYKRNKNAKYLSHIMIPSKKTK